MPTYNDGHQIEETIKSVSKLYEKNRFEIIVVNDCSTDNTLDILRKLKNKYKLRLINNKKNKGKAVSVNLAFSVSKGDILIVVDSDMSVDKEALNDILARFDENPKVGGISCRYKVRNQNNFLTRMQDLEYNMVEFVAGAYNPFSTIGLWGGFMAFRRQAFKEIKGLSLNCLTEDLDSALKLNELGWKVKQSYACVYTDVPQDLKSLYKQKMRWHGGLMQGIISHYMVYLKNPLAVFFMLSYIFFIFLFIFSFLGYINIAGSTYSIMKGPNFAYGNMVASLGPLWAFLAIQLQGLAVYFIFTIPYVIFDKSDRKKVSKYLLLIPYAFIYFPIFIVVAAIAFVKVGLNYKSYKEGKRAW